jgi:hypothetical protein
MALLATVVTLVSTGVAAAGSVRVAVAPRVLVARLVAMVVALAVARLVCRGGIRLASPVASRLLVRVALVTSLCRPVGQALSALFLDLLEACSEAYELVPGLVSAATEHNILA